MPNKPSIDTCIHDQPNFKVYCSNNQSGNEYDLDVNETHKFIMHSIDNYSLLLRYIKKLELRLKPKKKSMKTEVRKFIKNSEKIMLKLSVD